MPTMSLDFSITQIYRLVANDLLMICDALLFYRKYKKHGKTVKEFSDVLANLVEVEYENFDEIKNINKLSHAEATDVYAVVWDYVHDVVIKHVLDDLSQYPFWMAKILVTTRPHVFGLPVVEAWAQTLRTTYEERGTSGLFQGVVPYLVASVIINHKYVLKSTQDFVQAVLSRIPHTSSSLGRLETDLEAVGAAATAATSSGSVSTAQSVHLQTQHTLDQVVVASQQLLRSSGTPTVRPKRRGSKSTAPKESYWMTLGTNAAVATLSHPFLVLSVNMIVNPALQSSYCVGAYVKLLATAGVRGLYRGVRTRAFMSLLPLSPLLLLGISDSVMYRRMLGQGSSQSGGMVSVLRDMVSREEGGAPALLNYGLVTLAHVVPGFLSFVGMRTLSRVVFGTSLQRRHQISRRKEIVESHLNTLKKKNAHDNSSVNLAVLAAPTGAVDTAQPPPLPSLKSGMSRTKSSHFDSSRPPA